MRVSTISASSCSWNALVTSERRRSTRRARYRSKSRLNDVAQPQYVSVHAVEEPSRPCREDHDAVGQAYSLIDVVGDQHDGFLRTLPDVEQRPRGRTRAGVDPARASSAAAARDAAAECPPCGGSLSRPPCSRADASRRAWRAGTARAAFDRSSHVRYAPAMLARISPDGIGRERDWRGQPLGMERAQVAVPSFMRTLKAKFDIKRIALIYDVTGRDADRVRHLQ